MKAIIWLLRALVFALLFAFALQNTAPVILQLPLGLSWQAPLVIVLLLFFAAGALLGLLALLGLVFRQRREMARLKAELAARQVSSPADAEVAQPLIDA